MNFENLGLKPGITKAVERIGFVTPTPIQKKAIPAIINGDTDLVGLAQTGTGKTAAFGLPMIQLMDFSQAIPQGLIICPTRELCIQIYNDFKAYTHYIKKAEIVAVYGGASIENQVRKIKKGVQVIVATPGRLLDLINRKIIKLHQVSYVVLDEADEMLNMGFKEDLDAILSKTPGHKKTWLFSATMPKEVGRIAGEYMQDPVEITVGRRNGAAGNIEHVNYIVNEKDRYPALKRIIDFYPDIFSLVFCRTRNETRKVADHLFSDGYNAQALHGDLSQSQRDHVMKQFRDKSIQVLVATDVAARGLDVQDITHVINYNLPDEAEGYTHRSGRTARAGKSGISIALMNTKEKYKLRKIEKTAGIQFTYKKVPGGSDICEKQLFAMIDKMVGVSINHQEIEKFLTPVYNTLAGLSREELIQRFVSMEFNRFLNYYKNSHDINASAKSKAKTKKQTIRKSKNRNGKKTKRFFLNKGEMDHIGKGAITRWLCDTTGINSRQIGKIDIMREFSFFDVDHHMADKVLVSTKKAKLDGQRVRVQLAMKRKI